MFSIKESLKYGWRKSRENFELVLFSTLLLLGASVLVNGFSILWLIGIVFLIIIRIGYTKIFLKFYDDQNPRFPDIFHEYGTFWRYLGVSILFPLTVLGGLILIIIPGLIWAIRFSLSPIIIVDAKIGPVDAMKRSYAITKGNFWRLLLFWISVGLINLFGLILLGIGLLVSIPVTTLASIYVYRTLSKARPEVSMPTSPQAA